MDSLQKQMEEHTVTVHESMTSWTNAEEELARLGVPLDNDSTTSTHLNHVDSNRGGGAEEEPQPL